VSSSSPACRFVKILVDILLLVPEINLRLAASPGICRSCLGSEADNEDGSDSDERAIDSASLEAMQARTFTLPSHYILALFRVRLSNNRVIVLSLQTTILLLKLANTSLETLLHSLSHVASAQSSIRLPKHRVSSRRQPSCSSLQRI
jgi:hypothetical protein